MWFKNTIQFWPELFKELRVWWIFKRTANRFQEDLNKEHSLRVDWLGRIYGVVNLPEEVQGASGEIQQAYVLNKITKYGDSMLKIGLADIVYPEIQKVKGTASYLVILWPAFETLQIIEIIKGLFKNAIFGFLIYIIYRLIATNTDILTNTWDWFIKLI